MRPSWSEHPTALQTQVGDSRATTWLRRYMDNAAWGVDEVQRLHSAAVRYGGSSGPEGGGSVGSVASRQRWAPDTQSAIVAGECRQ